MHKPDAQPQADASMPTRWARGRLPWLVALNVLALGCVVLTWPQRADAQGSGGGSGAAGGVQPSVRPAELRARGDYTMATGRIGAGGNDMVYVVDSANQEIIALRWDTSKQVMLGVGYRNLSVDGRGARGR